MKERETQRERDRETHTHTQREREREGEGERERHTDIEYRLIGKKIKESVDLRVNWSGKRKNTKDGLPPMSTGVNTC